MFELAEAEKCLTWLMPSDVACFVWTCRHVMLMKPSALWSWMARHHGLFRVRLRFPAKGLDGLSVDVSGDTFLQLAHHTDASLVFVGRNQTV